MINSVFKDDCIVHLIHKMNIVLQKKNLQILRNNSDIPQIYQVFN